MQQFLKVTMKQMGVFALVLFSLIHPTYAAASNPVLYKYDELGRLVGVTDEAGNSATYRYDAVGNIISIVRSSSTQPVIMDFTPNGGAVGSQVIIAGNGFSNTPGQSVVKFNGTVAEVITSSSTQIVTSVPAGATTGPISVATPAGTTSSDTPFVIGASKAPTISGFTPSIGVAGTSVNISGNNFDTSSNKVEFNNGAASVTMAAPKNIIVAVPPKTASGRISVTTAFGKASSDADFFVTPAPFNTSDIQITGRMSVGDSKEVAISAPGKKGLILFDGVGGQKVSLVLSSITLASGAVSILRPDGITLASANFYKPNGFLDTVTLPSTGTYTILINPSASSSGNLTIGLNAITDVFANIASNGAAVTIATSTPGQNANLTFSATAGQRFSMNITSVALTGGCCLTISVIGPDGTTLVKPVNVSSSGTFIDLQTAPLTGNYTIKFDPTGIAIGKVSAQLIDVPPDRSDEITIGGPAVTIVTTVPGQNANLTFAAIAGQRFSINLSGVALTGGSYLTMLVTKPDGTTLIPSRSVSSSGMFVDVQTAPMSGTYTIRLDPNAMTIGKLTVQLFDVPPDPASEIVIGGPTVTVATTTPGQNASLTFSATAGQPFTMNFSGVTLTGGSSLTMTVVNPDGTTLVAPQYISKTGAFIDLRTAPQTGTYKIKLDPSTLTIGNLTLQLFDVPPLSSVPIEIGGPGVTVVAEYPGQNMNLTFNGAAAQSITIRVTGTTIACQTISLRKPDGSSLSSSFKCGTTYALAPQVLPVAGAYAIVVDPYSSNIGKTSIAISSP